MLNDLTPIMLGLASAISWGSGDFVGGLASKHSNVLAVVAISQTAGLAALILLGILVGEPAPNMTTFLWSGAAGLAGGIGLTSLYRGLAMGEMGIVAPTTGVVTASLPAVMGFFLEGPPTSLQSLGFVLAVGGVGLAAGFSKSSRNSLGLAMGLVAGTGFGLFLVFIGQVGGQYFFWPLALSRCITVAACITLATLRKTSYRASLRILLLLLLGGLLDAGGSGFFLMARHTTRLDVSAVLSSLYPVATVILAYLILGEKPTKLRTLGIALAIAAIPMISV